MEIVVGCLLSFLCGVVCTLTIQVVDVKRTKTADSSSDKGSHGEEVSKRDERLREQWESFLNYNGEEKMGGDE